MRVLMLTQALDAADPVLSFAVDWVAALAARVERLDVLCLRADAPVVPANVRILDLGATRARSRVRRLVEFERRVTGAIRDVDVIVAHMSPRFVVAGGPAALAGRKPVVLWYVHRQASTELRIATAMSTFVATAVGDSFPLRTAKLRVLGHGVNSAFFSPDPNCAADSPPLIVLVGRLSAIKHQHTLVQALSQLPPRYAAARVTFAGGVPDGQDASYARRLPELATELGVESRVIFTGPLSREGVRDLYRRATVAVNLSPSGLFDKAALESMMASTPTIVASPSFDGLVEGSAPWLRLSSPEDAAGLAATLDRVLDLPESARRQIGAQVRARAVEANGLDAFMDRLVALLRSAAM
ncbi:MAG TPA: glycosyltransferase family 4 protein [Vicinamibacterales bacterium]|nr:glycosyltransferase family 4 protein [Vicinamibacterales bacterium]